MKKTLTRFMLIAIVASLSSCFGDDIDDLQNQITELDGQIVDLDGKLNELEQSQQQALLNEIATLQTALQALQSEMDAGDADLAAQYAQLLTNLETLEAEVVNNENAIFYGNVITDEDFTAVMEQGASIVTGKVIVTSQAQATSIANIEMIGESLTISSSESVEITALKNVASDVAIVDVTGEAVEVSLPMLTAVGANFEIENNSGLTLVDAPELVLIYDMLSVEENSALTTLTMSKLDWLGELFINNIDYDNPSDPNLAGCGQLISIDLSDVDIDSDAYVAYLGYGSTLSLGAVNDNLSIYYSGMTTLSVAADQIGGDFTINGNAYLETVSFDNLSSIGGDFYFDYNAYSGFGGPSTGLSVMPTFEALTFIGGNVSISGNSAMKTIDAFHNVTEVQGSQINISSNGFEIQYIDVFNGLVDTYDEFFNAAITIYENTEWFSGFESLVEAGNVEITINLTMDPTTYIYGDVARFDGFDNLTTANTLVLGLDNVTEFNAFPSLVSLTGAKYDWSAGGSIYLKISMPSDAAVTTCSMNPILSSIKNGDFDADSWKTAYFSYNYSSMDRDTAIDQLLASCI